ncbi:hypothetical protein HYALB_00005303 [Hymenoscyphus albidus]|uniref:SAP domain-containing protein n=1 Tax=Hymenoscyphus albidus TaxID=595503 RepID=A0A9N9Q1C9_9HELO|nr:hypothetical protein HYALB_00005303 [Hymenoscyphus albidus]
MPHSKRPLEEVDGNALKDGQTHSHSHAKRQNFSMRAPLAAKDDDVGDENAEMVEEHDAYDDMLDYKTIDYTTKDDSKLRCLLRDRNLSDTGTRQEMIKTPQQTALDYETFTSDELTEMLYNRHLRTATGTKQTKIARLLLNDHLDCHSGNSEEGILYGSIWAFDVIPISIKRNEEELAEKYNSWTEDHLRKHLEEKNLSTTGTAKVLAKRALKAEKEHNDKYWEDLLLRKDSLQAELDALAGHAVDVSAFMKAEEWIRHRDHKIQSEAKRATPRNPICDYDISTSPWAEKSELELHVVCLQMGMPGRGHAPKAAQIKWLETGKFEYSDLYMDGLLIICEMRLVPTTSKMKKGEVIELLEECDEREGVSGWTAWDEPVRTSMVEVWYEGAEDVEG